MLEVDIRVGGNAIKIAENDPVIECIHDLPMILLKVKGVPLLIELVSALIG